MPYMPYTMSRFEFRSISAASQFLLADSFSRNYSIEEYRYISDISSVTNERLGIEVGDISAYWFWCFLMMSSFLVRYSTILPSSSLWTPSTLLVERVRVSRSTIYHEQSQTTPDSPWCSILGEKLDHLVTGIWALMPRIRSLLDGASRPFWLNFPVLKFMYGFCQYAKCGVRTSFKSQLSGSDADLFFQSLTRWEVHRFN